MEKVRLKPHMGLAAAAMLFLWNPHVNVIDVLPDCIGWLLLALSMTGLAYVNEDIAAARRKAWMLFTLTTVKLAPMVFSVMGEKTFELLGEPVMILVYTVCFGTAEAVLGMSVIRTWIASLSQIGLMHDSRAAIRRSDKLRRSAVSFFLLRAAGSIVPELVYLRSTEYLGNVVYGVVIDIRDYRPYLIFFCAVIVGIVGIVWLISMLRYLHGLKKELRTGEGFGKAISALEEERQEMLVCGSTLERFSVAFGMMLAGAVFLCNFTFENINILPDFVGVLLLFGAVLLLRKYQPAEKSFLALGGVTTVLTVPYYIVRTWHSINHHGFWADNLADYFTRNVTLSEEKQAYKMGLQMEMLLLAVVETVLLILFFRLLLKALQKLNSMTFSDGVTLYGHMTANMMRAEKEKYERMPKKVFLWFCISAAMEVVRALPVFAFVVTPIAVVRMVINVIFVWVFAEYLSSLRGVISYHYRYNAGENGETENARMHEMLH